MATNPRTEQSLVKLGIWTLIRLFKRQAMKNALGYLFCILILNSCLTNKTKSHFELDASEISKITIVKSLSDIPLELDENQIQKFVSELNRNTPKGPHKFVADYWVDIYFPNDSILTLKCNELIFGAGSSYAYKPKKENLFNELWNEMDADKRAWKLFTPVEKNSSDERLYRIYNYEYTDEELINIPAVLNYYNIENKIIDRKIYYRGEEFDKELFWNYTLKSKDSNWLETHKE